MYAPLALLIILAATTYHELLTHTFLSNWDDQVYITRNQAIKGFNLPNLEAAFSNCYVGNYAPVQIISYMLDYTIWGENPLGYLLANIMYHLVSGLLLFVIMTRFGHSRWTACAGAAVFLVHPVQVESVAWLSQRKNLLAMLFYLLAFLSYMNYRRGETVSSARWYWLSLFLFGLSLLAKSVAVIFPVMLVLYDLLFAPVRSRLKDHSDKVPYLLAAFVVAILTIITQGVTNGGGGRAAYPADALITLPSTMLPVLTTYLGMVVWPDPAKLSIMYFPEVRNSPDMAVVSAAGLLVMALVVGVALYRIKRPNLFWYILFFLGLLPVSQLVPLITWMNDRYLYFPMIGVAGLTSCSIGSVVENASGIRLKLLAGVVIALIVALSVISFHRGQVWSNSISLFSDAVEKYPRQPSTWSRLAEGYLGAGEPELAKKYYEKAVTLGSLDYDANYNLVQLCFEAGDYQAAFVHIQRMLSDVEQAHRAQLALGEYYLKTGFPAEAERAFTQFLKDYPGSVHGLYGLGQVYLMTGNPGLAADLFFRAVSAGGAHPGLFFSLACAELRMSHLNQSYSALQEAFERGLSGTTLHQGNACFDDMQSVPELRLMIRQRTEE